jgi:group I intron endonuclease
MDLRNIPKEPGVYKITNIVSGKSYVGNSINLRKRAQQHKYLYKSKESLLYLDMKTFGVNCFSFEVIELLKLKELLTEREYFWISKLKSEYNKNGKNFSSYTDYKYCDVYDSTDVSEILNIEINDVCDLIIKKEIPFFKISNVIRFDKLRFNEYLAIRNNQN